MSDKSFESQPGESAGEDLEARDRREFLISLGKWSKAVVGGVLLGGVLAPDREAEAQGWESGGGSGGIWYNSGGGWGGWINAPWGRYDPPRWYDGPYWRYPPRWHNGPYWRGRPWRDRPWYNRPRWDDWYNRRY